MKAIRVMLPLVCGPPIWRYVSHANFPVTGSFSSLYSWFHRIKRFPFPRKRRVAHSSSRVRFRLPTKKRSPRNHTVGLGFGPGSGERWRWKQSPRLRDQHRLGKVGRRQGSMSIAFNSCR